MTPEDFQPVAATPTREAWHRALCMECGRFSVRRHLDINSRVARQATFWCVLGHRWMTTWERP